MSRIVSCGGDGDTRQEIEASFSESFFRVNVGLVI